MRLLPAVILLSCAVSGCLVLEPIRARRSTSAGDSNTQLTGDQDCAGCIPQPTCPGVTNPNAPVLFFSDLVSGPNSGGVDDQGAFISLYGERFGASRGNSTVTIGGHEVARYTSWAAGTGPRGLDVLVVQPGPSTVSGDIVLHVGGLASNSLPFSIDTGTIYFVSAGDSAASDSNSGTDISHPLASLYRVRQMVGPGDIVYVKGGTYDGSDPEDSTAAFALEGSIGGIAQGSAAAPIAYVGYPGDAPTIGGTTNADVIFGKAGRGNDVQYYTLANVVFATATSPVEVHGQGLRLVANQFSGLATGDSVIGVDADSHDIDLYGNIIVSNGGTSGEHDAVVLTTGSISGFDFGWNNCSSQKHGDCLRIGSDNTASGIDDVRIHDNLLRNNDANAVDIFGSEGAVVIFNNLMTFESNTALNVNGAATISMLNNTAYENYFAHVNLNSATGVTLTVDNNIFDGTTMEPYCGGYCDGVVGAGNWFGGASSPPAWDAQGKTGDPAFASTTSEDFHLQAGSPAIDSGVNEKDVCADYDGIIRPQGSAYDAGAYER